MIYHSQHFQPALNQHVHIMDGCHNKLYHMGIPFRYFHFPPIIASLYELFTLNFHVSSINIKLK